MAFLRHLRLFFVADVVQYSVFSIQSFSAIVILGSNSTCCSFKFVYPNVIVYPKVFNPLTA